MNKNILFKQNGDTYDMWYIDKEGEHDMGVNFAIPEGTKIEDYPIKIEEFDSSGKRELRPCQNLKVILANPPKETDVVIFSIDAGIVSTTDTALKIEKELIVRNNKNTELTLPEVKGAKPYLTFYKLNIESNKDSALLFTRLSSKSGEKISNKETFRSLREHTSTYSGNSNINFVVHSGFVNFDILSNKGESNKERVTVICDALVSNLFNNDIKATYNLSAGGYQETITLTLNSDIINAGGTKYELSCPTKIVCEDKTIKEDKEYYINEISGFGSESCDLKGIKGTLNGRLEHVSGEGLMIGKDSGIYIIENNDTSKDEKTHKPHCEIRNVKVAKGSQLSVYMASPKDGNKSEVVLINNVVNSGTIKNAGSLTITNCELNHAEIIQNDSSVETKCSNSLFSGENSLYCVESIDCSTITNCVLYPESKEVVTPLNIKDEELDGIKNYTKYKEISKAKEIVRNSVKQRDSFNEVEIL